MLTLAVTGLARQPRRSAACLTRPAQRVQARTAEATRAEPARDRRPGAEAPGSGKRRRLPKTNLRMQATTSSGASRRGDYGALDALPSLPTGSCEHRPTPETGVGESQRVWPSFRGATRPARAPSPKRWDASLSRHAEAFLEPRLLRERAPDLGVDGYRRGPGDPVSRPKPHRGGELSPRSPPVRADAVGSSGRTRRPLADDPKASLNNGSARRAPARAVAGSSWSWEQDRRIQPKLDASFVVPMDSVHLRLRSGHDLAAGARQEPVGWTT